MGLSQDALLGSRLMSMRDVLLTKSQLFDLLMQINNWDGCIPKPAIQKPKPLWTGKQVLSLIIPKINYIRVNDDDARSFYLDEASVIIKRGEFLAGLLGKAIVGNTRGSLIGCIWIDFGPDRAKNFFTDIQRIINNWLLISGFTVGIDDTIVPDEIIERIAKLTMDAKQSFYQVLQDTQKDKKRLIVH